MLSLRASQIYGSNGLGEGTDFWAVTIVTDAVPRKTPYIYDALKEAPNWNQSHIKYLSHENATKNNILSSIEWLRDHADSDDIILFSFHGHGSYNGTQLKGTYGIIPWDEEMVTRDELAEKFNEVQVGALCLIFDSCMSGNLVDNKNALSGKMPGAFIRGMSQGLEGNNRVILMSTLKYGLGFGQAVDEVHFSRFIADAFRGLGDLNEDGACTAEEAFLYAKEKFDPYAYEMLLSPIPQIFAFVTTGFFILAFPTLYDSYIEELPIITG